MQSHWRRRLFLIGTVLGVWLVLGLLDFGQHWLRAEAEGRPIGRPGVVTTFAAYLCLALLTPLVWAAAKRWPLNKHEFRRGIAVHAALAVSFPVLHLGMSAALAAAVTPGLPMVNLTGAWLLGYYAFDVFRYCAMVGAFLALLYYRRYQDELLLAAAARTDAARLEASLAEARLTALNHQLQPHFLFNTLNSISVLALQREHDAVIQMIARLSELLRASLERTATSCTLREEIGFARLYLDIEQIRFDERLQVVIDVPEELMDAELPALVLQPIVENAVRHGIGRSVGPGSVRMHARRDGSELVISVQDTGPGFQGRTQGVGLSNVRARLAQLYGTAARLVCESPAGGGALVMLRLPLERHDPAGAALPLTAAAT